jgi:predicted ATPase
VGRTREAADLEQAVARSRLTVVTGPGGVGKTRLALEIARRRCGRGLPILVVDLGVIGQADQVPIAVAHALGLTQTGPDPTTDVVRALADTRGLVVVDICEHVASAAATLIGALLQGCPKLKVLATSRQHLPMTGARIVTLGPAIALPPDGSGEPSPIRRRPPGLGRGTGQGRDTGREAVRPSSTRRSDCVETTLRGWRRRAAGRCGDR